MFYKPSVNTPYKNINCFKCTVSLYMPVWILKNSKGLNVLEILKSPIFS
jgi:hypothetical protein